jgi:flagellar biosynthesis protein FlhB
VPADSGGGEKSELPTPKKLRDAREEGQVSFSPEVNTSGMLLIGFITLAMMGPGLWDAMAVVVRRSVSEHLVIELNDASAVSHLFSQYAVVANWLVPFLGVLFAAGLLLSIGQVGFHPTLKPLMPKLARINPLTGLGRLFGMRGLMRFVFSFSKLVLVLLIAYWVLSHDIPKQTYINLDLGKRMASESWALFMLAFKLAAVLALIAFGDFVYQRIQHTRDLMMTKQEIKEEMRQSEGDPLIKMKIRQIQRQMAQKRMMQEVPKADVVITNPTHVAVALKYNKDTMAAPIVIAKGYDAIAQRIKAIAAENNITMVENIDLARALAKEVEIGHPVPLKWYQAVAEVLSIVYKLKKAS